MKKKIVVAYYFGEGKRKDHIKRNVHTHKTYNKCTNNIYATVFDWAMMNGGFCVCVGCCFV